MPTVAQGLTGAAQDAVRALFRNTPGQESTVSIEAARHAAEPGYALVVAALAQTNDPFQQARLHQMRVNLSELVATGNISGINQAMSAIEAAAAQAAAKTEQQGGMMESREQKVAHLWSEVHELDEDIRQRMLRLYREGVITKDQYDEYTRRQNFADTLAQNDPHKAQAELRAINFAEEATRPAAEHGNRDAAGVGADADKVRRDIAEINGALDRKLGDDGRRHPHSATVPDGQEVHNDQTGQLAAPVVPAKPTGSSRNIGG